MDEDRRVSKETISTKFDVSMGTVHTIIHEQLKMRKICTKFVPRVLSGEQEERRHNNSREMVEFIDSDPEVLEALVTCDESWIYCYDPESKRQSFQWKHAGSPQTQEGQTEQVHPETYDDPFFDSKGMIYLYWVPSGQTVNKECYVEVLREFRKKFRRFWPTLFTSGRWHFHQVNTPVHNSVRVSNYLTKMGIKTIPHPPCSPDLAPCNFSLFRKLKEDLRESCFETIEEMKEAVTRVVDTFTLEDFQGTFQKLVERYNKCIAARGEYFEGD